MNLPWLQFPLQNPHYSAIKPNFSARRWLKLPPFFRIVMTKEQLSYSYGGPYVPPHHRNCSVFVSAAAHSEPTANVTTYSDAKRLSFTSSEFKSNCDVIAAGPYSYSLDHGRQEQFNQNEISMRDEGAKKSSDLEFVLHTVPFESSSENIIAWERKLNALACDRESQELVSREKKDRCDFEQIAALARRMGLYSHLYAKAVVVSKVPLPNYRFDLDDKRPKREVILPPGLLRNVNAYLKGYLSVKCKNVGIVSRLSSKVSIAIEESLFEEPESLPNSKATLEILRRRSQDMLNAQRNWQDSPEGRKRMEFRRTLPAYTEKDILLRTISENQVVIISGETGCGKTTQIPQYILESEIHALRGAMCNVICTQPRRISAMSVSERIATERGEKLGETVGYRVRLEGIKGRNTRLLFCTTGILLRRLLVDGNLKGVTHVIIDEIHERGLNEDFLLTVLKDLLPRRPELRLILMSATLDAELFSSYFNGAPVLQIPGFTYPVRSHFLENILETTGYQLTEYNQIDDYGMEKTWKMKKQASRKRKSRMASAIEDALNGADFTDYNAQTRDSLSCWSPDCLGFNLIEHLLCRICEDGRPGAVLVFVTGWDDIRSLKDKLEAHPVLGDTNRVLLLACHGSMGNEEQKLIFNKPGNGIRKIVIATNIAETSITIDDVVFVIDCGKAKETSYDALNNTPCLLPSWISKGSAKQRRGRAGRVQPGECYHLYPRCIYDAFADYQLPEILRTPLQSLCLLIKSLKLGGISEFLSRALESPENLAVQNAIEYLKIIGAFDESENLTVLGNYLTMLPMEPKLGKMLILGAIFNCLDPILTVVAGLSGRDPFLTPLDKKDLAEAAKAQFSHDYSDHLALVRAYEGWKFADSDLSGSDYCWKNFLSVHSMKAIDSLRKEFYSILEVIGIVDSNPAMYNVWSYDEHLLRAIICYGLYPGICSIVHNQKSISLKTMEDGHVNLQCNSVNGRHSEIPYPWLVFSEKVKVNSVFLRDSTAVSDSILLLFGGRISRGDRDGHLKMLGGYLEFFMDASTAELYLRLKGELDELIQTKLLNPAMGLHSCHQLLSAVRLLISKDHCDGRFVFNHEVLPLSHQFVAVAAAIEKPKPGSIHNSVSGPGGENSKNQLQTLLVRAGYTNPVYQTKQLKDNQFQSTVKVNDTLIAGQPCSNKKQAEKDAATEALRWLLGRNGDDDYVDHMSMLLKNSKKDQI